VKNDVEKTRVTLVTWRNLSVLTLCTEEGASIKSP
jgi:hypothetical protein